MPSEARDNRWTAGSSLPLGCRSGPPDSAPSTRPMRTYCGRGGQLRRTVGHFCLGRLLEPLVEASTDLLGRQLRPLPLLTDDDDTRSGDTGEAGETDSFPEVHDQETLQWMTPYSA